MVEAARADFVLIEDCGHMVPMEQPQRLAHAVGEWLERVLAG
jgi:pimeloyl-ACP methyl ester carboxylesterase